MRDSLRKWAIGMVAVGCMLMLVACEAPPAGQSQQKGKTPDFGAIADLEGEKNEKDNQTEKGSGQPAAAPAAPAAPGESTQK